MLIVLSIDTNKLPPHTREEFIEWLKFEVGQICGMSLKNPLTDCDIKAIVREVSPLVLPS